MRTRTLILIVLVVCLSGALFADASDTAKLSLTITTTFGVPIEKAQVKLVSVGPRQTFMGRSDASGEILFKIPFGLYDVEVESPGFRVSHERIGAYQAKLSYHIGLALGYPHEVGPRELRGRVSTKLAGGKHHWVRLVAVYSGDLVESSVDHSGTFVIAGLLPGRYVLLLFEKDTLLATQEVEFFGGVKTLDIKTTEQGRRE